MNTILRPIRQYPILAFAILACLIGWVQYIVYAFGGDPNPGALPLGPMISALIVAACMRGDELKAWGRRLITFRTRIGWYMLAVATPIVIITIVALVNYALGATPPTASQLAIWTDLPGAFIFTLLFIGIGEEAGWTAFAAPMLLRSNSFIKTWLILSAIRVFWHIPLMLSGDGLPWVLGTFGNIAFQFLVLWIFQRSNQRWFIAPLFHATLNTIGGNFFFRLVSGTDQAHFAVLMATGFAIMALTVYFLDRKFIEQPK